MIDRLALSVDGLDAELNAHRLARYEFVRASDTLIEYLRTGSGDEASRFQRHLQRCVDAVSVTERRRIVSTSEALAGSIQRLTQTERAQVLRTLSPTVGPPAPIVSVSHAAPGHNAEVPTGLSPASDVAYIVRVLESIPRGMLRWAGAGPTGGTRVSDRWLVTSEADVQSLVWLVLSPVVPDLVSEESPRKIGLYRPRADFAVPRQGIAVEIKFIGRRGEFREIMSALAADQVLYLGPGSPYSYLVVFVWDDTRSSELHGDFIRGLRALGITDAVVISRPGAMAN